MKPPKSIFLERAGVKLHALDHGGEGKPVLLLLHGAAAHAHWWDALAPRFADLFRPVALDLRGHGDSDWTEDYSYEAFAADLEDWIAWARREAGSPPSVLAHSLGGIIVLKLYERRPPDLRGLILVDAPLQIDARILENVRSLGRGPSRPWVSPEAFIEKFRLVPSGGSADAAEVARLARHSLRRQADGTWILKADKAFHRDRQGTDLRDGWRRIGGPVMLIVGERSDRLSPEEIEWIGRACPQVEVRVIRGAHHHVQIDAPEAFARAAREFFLRLS